MVNGFYQIYGDFCVVCIYVGFPPKDTALEITKTESGFSLSVREAATLQLQMEVVITRLFSTSLWSWLVCLVIWTWHFPKHRMYIWEEDGATQSSFWWVTAWERLQDWRYERFENKFTSFIILTELYHTHLLLGSCPASCAFCNFPTALVGSF